MEVDVRTWSDVKNFLDKEFSTYENIPVIFSSEEDGYSIEWTTNGLCALRIWPPEEGNILIEFHAVRYNEYCEWNISLNDLVLHFKDQVYGLLTKFLLI